MVWHDGTPSASRGRLAMPVRQPAGLDSTRARPTSRSCDHERPVVPPAGLDEHAPLAARMRPRELSEVVGQAPWSASAARCAAWSSTASWPRWSCGGRPGTGKTTLARLLAEAVGAPFATLSAVMSGVADVRAVIARAREWLERGGGSTVLFIDEIHRFNKAQQDALLPQVEDGTITLIGATTENPYFEVNSALLVAPARLPAGAARGRRRAHGRRACAGRRARLGGRVAWRGALEHLVGISGGDARAALNILEAAVGISEVDGVDSPSLEDIEAAAQQRVLAYDRAGDGHYDTVSAFIKSCAATTPTRRCTGWRRWSRQARTRGSSRGA